MPIDTIEAVRQLEEANRRIAALEGDIRDYERSMENANRSIRELKDKLAAVERENREKCLELAEKAQEIRELRGVVDAAAAFVNGNAGYNVARASWKGDEFDELRKRLDALDLDDDAPRPETEPVTQPREIVDLMAALKASLAALKASLEVYDPHGMAQPASAAPEMTGAEQTAAYENEIWDGD